MGNADFDIQLDRSQSDAVSEALGRLINSPRKQDDPMYKTTESMVSLHWQMYLTNVLIEATHIAKGQKTRTARKRHDALKQVEAYLGHYPSDAEVRSLFENGAPNESTVKVIIEDVHRLRVQPPPQRRRSGIEVLEDRLAKLKRKGSPNKRRTTKKRPVKN